MNIIEMAKEAGFTDHEAFAGYECTTSELLNFAALVAAHERDKFCAVLRQIHDSISLESSTCGLKQSGKCSYGERGEQ